MGVIKEDNDNEQIRSAKDNTVHTPNNLEDNVVILNLNFAIEKYNK